MNKLKKISLSIVGLSLSTLSTFAIAGGPDSSVAPGTAAYPDSQEHQWSIFMTTQIGREYSSFNNSNFINALRDTGFSADLPTRIGNTNKYEATLGRFGVGVNFLKYLGVQADLFTSFNNKYNITFSGTTTGSRFTDKFNYKFNMYDLLLNLHYQLKSIPLVFSFKPGIALLKLNADYTDHNDTLDNTASSTTNKNYGRPIFELAAAYVFDRGRFSNSLGLSWLHMIGSNNIQHTTTATRPNGTGRTIRDITKIPDINAILLTYSLQLNL